MPANPRHFAATGDDRPPIAKIGYFALELQARIDAEFRCLSLDQIEGDGMLRAAVRALITRSSCQVPVEVLDQLPALSVIATCGVGLDGIPLAEAQRRGIAVMNTPGVLDAAVCELGMGLLLGMLRQIPAADRHVRSGEWQDGAFPLMTSLQGLRVGIVGLGRIGRGMAVRLEPFGVDLGYSGTRKPDVGWRHHTSVTELASASDVLVICCKGGDQTRHLIDASVLSALGRGWIVNLSRGSVVDEAALCAALVNGELRGAALDVFDVEPLAQSPLVSLPNSLLKYLRPPTILAS